MSTTDVVVIDFQLNNLRSIVRGLELAGASRVRVAADPAEVQGASHLVLPGVGHFAAAMANLAARGWPQVLREQLSSLPLLGVCLGMQLLFDGSDEGPGVPGLGLISGRVARLLVTPGQRVPHVGWNSVVPAAPPPHLFSGLEADLDYYFVHSYVVATCHPDVVLSRTPFGEGEFVSAIGRGAITGVQFHPEKSSHAGIRLLTNFLRAAPC